MGWKLFVKVGMAVGAPALIALYIYVFLMDRSLHEGVARAKLNTTEALVHGGDVMQGPLHNGSLVPLFPGGDPGWLGSNATCSLGIYLAAGGRTSAHRCDTPPPVVLPPSGVVPGFYGPYTNCLPADQTMNADGTIAAQTCVPVGSLTGITLVGGVTGTNDNNTLRDTGVAPGLYGNASGYPIIGVFANGTTYHAGYQPLPNSTLTNETVAGGDLAGIYPNPQLRNVTDLTPGTYTNIDSVTISQTGLWLNLTTYVDAALRTSTLFSGPDIVGTSTYNTLTLTNTGVAAGCYTNIEQCIDAGGRTTSVTMLNATLGDIVYTTTVPNATGAAIGGTFGTGLTLLPVITAGCYQTVDSQYVCYNDGGQTISTTPSPITIVYGNTSVVSSTLSGTFLGGGLNLIPTGVSAGSYGGTLLTSYTVNTYGVLTASANGLLALTNETVFAGAVTGTYTSLALAPTGLPAGIYECNGTVQIEYLAGGVATAFGCQTSVDVTLPGDTTFFGYVHETFLVVDGDSITFRAAQPINTTSSVRFATVNVTGRLFVGDVSGDHLPSKAVGIVSVRQPSASVTIMALTDYYAAGDTVARTQIGAWTPGWGLVSSLLMGGAWTAAGTREFASGSESIYVVEYYSALDAAAQRWEWIIQPNDYTYSIRIFDEATLTDLFASPTVQFCPGCQAGTPLASPGLDTLVIGGSASAQANIEFVSSTLPGECLLQIRALDGLQQAITFGACINGSGDVLGYAVGGPAFELRRDVNSRVTLSFSDYISSAGQNLTTWTNVWEAWSDNMLGPEPMLVASNWLVVEGASHFNLPDPGFFTTPAPGGPAKNVFHGTIAGYYASGPSLQFNLDNLAATCPVAMYGSSNTDDHVIAFDGYCSDDCYLGAGGAETDAMFIWKTQNILFFYTGTSNSPAACSAVNNYITMMTMAETRVDAHQPFITQDGLHSAVLGTDLLTTRLGNNYNTLTGPAGSVTSPLWEHYISGDAGALYPVVQDGAYNRSNAYTAWGTYWKDGAWRNSVLGGCNDFTCTVGMVRQWDGAAEYLRVSAPSQQSVYGNTTNVHTYWENNFVFGTTTAAGTILVKPNPTAAWGGAPYASIGVTSIGGGGTSETGDYPGLVALASAQLITFGDFAYVTLGVNADISNIWRLSATGQRGFKFGQVDASTLGLHITQSGTAGNPAVFSTLASFTATDTTFLQRFHVGLNNVAQLGLNQLTVTGATPSHEFYVTGNQYPVMQTTIVAGNPQFWMGTRNDGAGVLHATLANEEGWGFAKIGSSLVIINTPAATLDAVVTGTTMAAFTPTSAQLSPGGISAALFTTSAITLSPAGTTAALFTTSTIALSPGGTPTALLTTSAITLSPAGTTVATLTASTVTLSPGGTLTTQVTATQTTLSHGGSTVATFNATRIAFSQSGAEVVGITSASVSIVPTTTFTTSPRVIAFNGDRFLRSDGNQYIVEADRHVNSVIPQQTSFISDLECYWTNGVSEILITRQYNFTLHRVGNMILLQYLAPTNPPFVVSSEFGPTPTCTFTSSINIELMRYWPLQPSQHCWITRGLAGGEQANYWFCFRIDNAFTMYFDIFQAVPGYSGVFTTGVSYITPTFGSTAYLAAYDYDT
jgi:hypothetical protein